MSVRAALASGASTVCRAWVLRRRDGVTLGFTDHDGDLVVEGVVCRAATGFAAGAVEGATGLAVDNAVVSGALSQAALASSDLRAGRWDGATVRAFLADWSDPSVHELVFAGALGEVTETDGRFSAELRGLADGLNVTRGRVFHRRCDAALGDARCGVDLANTANSATVVVLSIIDGGRGIRVGDVPMASGRLRDGTARFETGGAVGMTAVIRSESVADGGRILTFWSPPRAPLAVGGKVRLTVGCDKTMSTCRDVFANVLNFRGFPDLPGDDWVMAGPGGPGRVST